MGKIGISVSTLIVRRLQLIHIHYYALRIMFPRPPPPPLEPKPTLPLPFSDYHWKLQEDTIRRTLALAETEESIAALSNQSDDFGLLLVAIDPDTGDSVLHRAAAVGNVDFLNGIRAMFGKQLGFRPRVERLFWVLMVHQNLVGDTALHVAARAGNFRGAKTIYRLFHGDDLDVDNVRRGLDPDSGDPSAEDWEWDDFGSVIPSLVFVCTKNHAGRDAAAEARIAGHEDLAAWFDSLAQRLDLENMRTDETYMEVARQNALSYHYYFDESKRGEDN